jgi:hypothetical protein
VRRTAVVVVLLVLAAAAAYDAAIALGWIGMGTVSGFGPRGYDVVHVAAFAALFVATVLCLPGDPHPRPLPALLAPAGVAFVVARFYSYDAYYLPALRRMSDHGEVAPAIVYMLVVAAIVVLALSLTRPHVGLRAAAALLFVSMIVAVLEDAGH